MYHNCIQKLGLALEATYLHQVSVNRFVLNVKPILSLEPEPLIKHGSIWVRRTSRTQEAQLRHKTPLKSAVIQRFLLVFQCLF